MDNLTRTEEGLVVVQVILAHGKVFPGNVCAYPADVAKVAVDKGLVAYVLAEAQDQPVEQAADDAGDGSVVIPDDWQALHHTKKISLAKKIAGDLAPERATTEWATGVIETELALRAADTEKDNANG